MAKLPGVYPVIKDGGLGFIAPAGDGQRVLVGVSSAGATNQILGLADPGAVGGLLGSGPLARAAADHLAYGGGQVFIVRATADIAGSVVADVGNPANPAVTTSGATLDSYDIHVRITRAGAVGTSAFVFTLDGGDTWSAEIATAATYVLPGTGISLAFAAGNYALDNVYKFVATAPSASVSSIQAAVRVALDSNLLYESVSICQPSDAGMWAALDALALEAANQFRYIEFFAETIPPSADPDAWVAALLAAKASFSSRRVRIFAAYGEVVDTLSGRLEVQSLMSRIAARIASLPVHQKSSWVELGPLPGVVTIAPFVSTAFGKASRFNNAHALQLDTAGFTTVYRLQGRNGVYPVEDRTAADPTSDFKIGPNVRVMNKAITQVRQGLLNGVQAAVDPTNLNASLAGILASANAALREMTGAGEIARGRVVIPPGQNILSTQRLRLQIRIVPLGYLREIEAEFQFENPSLIEAAVATPVAGGN